MTLYINRIISAINVKCVPEQVCCFSIDLVFVCGRLTFLHVVCFSSNDQVKSYSWPNGAVCV